MAWGTDSCPKVEKIFGPGNQYVTAAKMILQVQISFQLLMVLTCLESLDYSLTCFFLLLQNSEAMVSIDMPAGPSEVLVIADEHASPVYIAADLLSQVFP